MDPACARPERGVVTLRKWGLYCESSTSHICEPSPYCVAVIQVVIPKARDRSFTASQHTQSRHPSVPSRTHASKINTDPTPLSVHNSRRRKEERGRKRTVIPSWLAHKTRPRVESQPQENGRSGQRHDICFDNIPAGPVGAVEIGLDAGGWRRRGHSSVIVGRRC